MLIVGNLCWCLAALIYLIPWQLLLNETARGPNAGAGLLWGSVIFALPLGLLLTGAWIAVVTRGGMDWLVPVRSYQYLAVLVAGLAITVVIAMSSALRLEPGQQIPWSMRWLVPAAAWAMPPLLIAAVAMALNSGPGATLLPLARGTWLGIAGLSLLVGLGLMVELVQWQFAQADARLQSELAFQRRRDEQMYAEVKLMDVQEDFARLLNFSNLYETEPIRTLALSKLAEHPDLSAGIRAELTTGSAYEAIIYLQGNQPPHPELLGDAIRIGIERVADDLAHSIDGTHTLYPDQGMSEVLRIIDVLAKFQGNGIDYRPAMRKLRAALDDPRSDQVRLSARGRMDRWLAEHQ